MLTVIFALLILLSVGSPRRLIAVCLIGALCLLLVAPPAQAQGGLFGAIGAVLNTINGVIGSALSLANAVLADIRTLYQQVVWPVNLINQAKAQVASMISNFRAQMQAMFAINPLSATLPNPAALESVMRDRQVGNLGALAAAFAQTYRAVPPAGAMAPEERNMTDMDDAMAIGNLKTLKIADQAQDLMLQAAAQVEDAAAISAPGSAPFLSASSQAACVRGQAVMLKMAAAELRQEAARLAHENALRKRGSALAVDMYTNVMRLLQR